MRTFAFLLGLLIAGVTSACTALGIPEVTITESDGEKIIATIERVASDAYSDLDDLAKEQGYENWEEYEDERNAKIENDVYLMDDDEFIQWYEENGIKGLHAEQVQPAPFLPGVTVWYDENGDDVTEIVHNGSFSRWKIDGYANAAIAADIYEMAGGDEYHQNLMEYVSSVCPFADSEDYDPHAINTDDSYEHTDQDLDDID